MTLACKCHGTDFEIIFHRLNHSKWCLNLACYFALFYPLKVFRVHVRFERAGWKWCHFVRLGIGWRNVSMGLLRWLQEMMVTVLCQRFCRLSNQRDTIWFTQRTQWIFVDSMQKRVRLERADENVMQHRLPLMDAIWCAAVGATNAKPFGNKSTANACSNGAAKSHATLAMNNVK